MQQKKLTERKMTPQWTCLTGIAAAGALALTMVLTGCHTVEGAGRDIQSIGDGVEDTADDVRFYE